MAVTLIANSYGKSDVRLTKVIRRRDRHDLLEFSVDIQLHGEFDRSYTHGDNSSIVATDSMKNTVYVLAKENDFDSAESFGILLAEHFLSSYSQVRSATVFIQQSNWSRIAVDGHPHDHAFVSRGADLHTARAIAARDVPTSVHGGIADLLVLKTTQSAFKGFVTDRYRTLKDTDDRIFATSVSAEWNYTTTQADFVSLHEKIVEQLLSTFANHMSYSAQETMYEMGKAALAAVPEISRIQLRLPNKHRVPVNLQPFGLENANEIFVWTDEPFGDLSATVQRSG
ncbi:MAG: urate oxidase [Phycisphaerae bacterium]|nr:urate oxidase [Phycisphaerae bacterium]